MLGLNDRIAIREPAAEKSDGKEKDKKAEKKEEKEKKDAKGKPEAKPDGAAEAKKPEEKSVDTDLPQDEADNDAPPISAPEKSARSPNGLYEFRDDRWVELYSKKIEEMIGVLKSKGVPVVWVGLPAVRGAKATSDMLFLDALYRDAAGKAGITYVDVWDGFVDEAGRFLQRGPDFEGQPRNLRSYDGVYFTQAGARKSRALCRARSHAALGGALRTDHAADRARNARRQCAARPARAASARRVRSCRWWRLPSAPINCSAAPDRGRPRSTRSPRARWSRANRWSPPAGRADDFSWPRREIGREQAKGETPVANAAPDGTVPATRRASRATEAEENRSAGAVRRHRSAISSASASARCKTSAARAAARPARQPRPPGNVGRSASVPGFFTR